MFSTAIIAISLLPVCDMATNALNARLVGGVPSESLARFVDYHANGKRDKFIPNPKFWLNGVDFSCVSPWNSGGGPVRAGTLISKRHIVFANHFPLWRGVRIVFVDQEGEVCPLQIEATKRIGTTDIMVGLLNYEVTPNIHPAKILPDDYARYIGDGTGFPVVTFNQHEEAFLSELRSVTNNVIQNVTSPNASWKIYLGRIRVGDSGDPAFMLIGNEPILLYCLSGGGRGCGPSIFQRRREIQAAMDELCPGYKLEAFDFSTIGK